MLLLALPVLLSLLIRGGTGQYQAVQPSFCPSSGLVGATCDETEPGAAPPQNTFVSQVNHLRCQAGCLMDVSWNGLTRHGLVV